MTWRDELESKTQNAIMKAMGQSSTFRSGLDNEEEVRKRNQLEDLSDDKVLSECKLLGSMYIISATKYKTFLL